MLDYCGNPKHKAGCSGDGPPRWFPSTASICPEDISYDDAVLLLSDSVDAKSAEHPNAKARYALDSQGRFFKAYSEDGGQTWHGYPVAEELVRRQIPSRVLREFKTRGLLSAAEYKRLIGSAK